VTTTFTIGSSSTAAVVKLSPGIGTVEVAALTINPGSTLDISNNGITISYGSAAADPVATIRSELAAAYAGHFSGAGLALTSSAAAGNPMGLAIGYADNTQTNQLKIAATVPGDADMDGKIDFNDLATIAANYGTSSAKGGTVSWSSGDVNYDGLVNFADLTVVAQQLGNDFTAQQAATLPASFIAQYQLAMAEVGDLSTFAAGARVGAAPAIESGQTSVVPEPAGAAVIALLAAAVLPRRRRQKVDERRGAQTRRSEGGVIL
jgi:MYXO-CTERM domain-containing protein